MSSSYPEMKFLFNFVFEKMAVAIISRTKRTATIWVRRPRTRASPPKTSSNVNRTANMAPPGQPVPFTNPIGFLMSLIFGQPWARNKAPSANPPMRPAGAATEPFVSALLHLDDPHARNPIQDVPRLLVDVIVPAEIARVVVREELQDFFGRLQPPGAQELLEKL